MAKQSHPTLADIAKIAKVAPMTVSRVINSNGYVSDKVRKRVQLIIDRLEYHPNALARSLKSQSTRVVGILLPDIKNPFSGELADSIQQVLLERGYSAFICTTEQSVQREQAALGAFFDHRVAGIVVATLETKEGDEALERFIRRGMPIVSVGREPGLSAVDRVTANHWRGGYDAAQHLIAMGHRHIAYVGASAAHARRLRRFEGFCDALHEHGLEVREEWVAGPSSDSGPGFSTLADGYAATQRLLDLSRRPTALFARNDFTAMGAISAARDRGLRIPEDLAIVGFDNVPLSAFTTPPLTTVQQPTAEQGQRAAQLLLERIEGEVEMERREVTFDCHLVIRSSTQTAAVTGP
ncbi:MAG TPA: LacI family DNA-binding transcriptional regulator [Candidatus Sulfopaludibacter sp.]|jgi:DNA-binding LacI/PurR family transcriptional regulator|nr:LacI family DNA-binding transcriptional regulator [Candidatus Sulfopaludibacter sp.]